MRSLRANEERLLSWVLDKSMSSLEASQSMNKDQPKPRDKDKDKPQDKGKLEDKDKETDKDKHSSIEVPTWVLRSLNARVPPRPKPGPKPDQL